jgi:hypothetical protein
MEEQEATDEVFYRISETKLCSVITWLNTIVKARCTYDPDPLKMANAVIESNIHLAKAILEHLPELD